MLKEFQDESLKTHQHYKRTAEANIAGSNFFLAVQGQLQWNSKRRLESQENIVIKCLKKVVQKVTYYTAEYPW